MSKTPYVGPKLPQTLLDEVHGSNCPRKDGRKGVSRKDRRKAERQEKKAAHVQSRTAKSNTRLATERHDEQRHHHMQPSASRQRTKIVQRTPSEPNSKSKPLKSILKQTRVSTVSVSSADSDSDSDDAPIVPTLSRVAKRRLDEDDAEIAALEKKLGIKGKKSKALEEEGLNWLADGLGSDSDSESPASGVGKRKRLEDEQWLQSKRQKATITEGEDLKHVSDEDADNDMDDLENSFFEDEVDSDADDLENPFSADELTDDSFGFDDDHEEPTPKKPRENPYVAPVSTISSASKYVPPSMRKAAGQHEDLSQLKRQVQGQLNRLTEANFLSILSVLEDIYSQNARQHVTSILVELFMGLVASASTLSENFLILHSAFATAIYKVIGLDFGTQLLESITTAISANQDEVRGKQTLNLLGFLSNLYIMQLVGSAIVFDYIKALLEALSEDNTELLLRVIRTAGVQLRQDNPTALKDIVLLLTRSVSKIGEDNLSVRTRFMIETINDLKNNRMKTGATASAVTSEHVVRMKKTLGTLNSRSLRSSEPLQVSLADLQDSEKRGKWWLVGASYNDPAKLAQQGSEPLTKSRSMDDGYESETPGHVSLPKLARAQGMNTDIRRAIFTAIMSASDFQDAHLRIMKLHLKNKQHLEIAKVLLHCAGAEAVYNPYYTLIAKKLCSEPKLQRAVQSSLWDVLRKISSDDDREDHQMSTSAVINLARLFGTLIADDQLSISALKTLEFALMPALAQTFAEVLFTSIMLHLHKAHELESSIQHVFAQAIRAPRMISGLQLFIRDVVAKAEISNSSKERRAIQRGCELALEALQSAVSGALSDDSYDSDENESD